MALVVKNPPANAGDIRDASSIPGSGRSPGGGHGNPLQYSGLENSTDRGAWRATVHRVAKSQTRLKGQHGQSMHKLPVKFGRACQLLKILCVTGNPPHLFRPHIFTQKHKGILIYNRPSKSVGSTYAESTNCRWKNIQEIFFRKFQRARLELVKLQQLSIYYIVFTIICRAFTLYYVL